MKYRICLETSSSDNYLLFHTTFLLISAIASFLTMISQCSYSMFSCLFVICTTAGLVFSVALSISRVQEDQKTLRFDGTISNLANDSNLQELSFKAAVVIAQKGSRGMAGAAGVTNKR